MKKGRRIELLAPAKDLECGIEAIRHGADAVYIGAPKFSARAAAGNTIDDIARLVAFAHLYSARVYVALNTILRDDELPQAEALTWELYRIGVDALIIQDMGLTRLHLPPIPLHASTQTDNRTAEKVEFLARTGFRQVVLARELSLTEIAHIHQRCPQVPLEVFVHGALCVSFSGQCYASQACMGRSANRGECAQFCRLPFSLVDADGKQIVAQKHLLSLRDLNQSDRLEELLDAGASSLKIEGRLKEVSYVKNVTAYYRQRLDAILQRRPEYIRASAGSIELTFTPQLDKSFSRGFTHYFLDGRQGEIASPHTPKSLGERMGTLKSQQGGRIAVAGIKPFHNGDGVCYLDAQGRLQGFRVNKVENGRLIAAGPVAPIPARTPLYRNYDQEFERLLSVPSAQRRLSLDWLLRDTPWGFSLTATDEEGVSATLAFASPHQPARTPQAAQWKTLLGKLGDTPFAQCHVEVQMESEWFIPASQLTDWRRRTIERLLAARRIGYRREMAVWRPTDTLYPERKLTYLGNVMNSQARDFYLSHGVQQVDSAYEASPTEQAVVMFCRHCLRYELGGCPTRQGKRLPFREPYYLVSSDGRRYPLEFDCRQCLMKVKMED